MRPARAILIWAVAGAAVAVPLALAALSPLLAWRSPVYIAAGFAGIVALGLLLFQPLAIGGFLPGLSPARRRRLHRFVGVALVAALVVHVAGLWITSPPDVVDALLFRSPTPFSAWGVIAMWAVFASAGLAALRRPLRIPPRWWRAGHLSLAVVIVAGVVAHALLIEGTMESVSKIALCGLVVAATVKLLVDRSKRRVTGRRAE
ncbi:ferric reductase-like transmembrane domain-containing protein [Amorphus coralli]|uniref:ferric reductase-like transmembrane domain-containing protein n=1 Tax=Amorphus coralli TaxID=340680 RepID=UPI0003716E17|nr:ferric reductase-like transmembrane domain-containing protein [Amorphus coralli]